ncbi:MAG: CinA family nicotinamide mononucleotide deamidase-related protein [Candidatus Hydrogenedentales bacterium]|jgi:nicotinamide-nucleotide amidase
MEIEVARSHAYSWGIPRLFGAWSMERDLMQSEIVMIGTELLLGQIVDTNATFLGQVLAENGINLYQKTTVGDNPERIKRALESALARADVVFTSGGLGPTEDDITRECIADVFGRRLELRAELVEQLEARFQRIGRQPTGNNMKQAYAPEGALALENPNGTAPGLLIEDARGIIIAMPGVPRELKPMLKDWVLPFLRKRFNLSGLVHYRVLKVCGVGESAIDSAIGHLIRDSANPTVGLLASPESVRIRIAARASTKREAEALIDAMAGQVHAALPGLVMGVDDETLEGAVAGLLRARGWRLALAETYTGGLIAQRLSTADSGAFAGGLVFSSSPGAGGDPARRGRALAEKARAQFGAECGFASILLEEAGQALAVLITPEGIQEWPFRFSSLGEAGQLRATVTGLERIRRHFAGVSVPVW